jgi:hypothetical protein
VRATAVARARAAASARARKLGVLHGNRGMKDGRLLAWSLFTVWATWMFALQARIGSGGDASRWIPDVGLVLALSLLARLDASDVPLCALLTVLARSSCSVEPNTALCAGILGVFFLALAVRSVVELTSPVSRTIAAGVLVFVFDAWLMIVHRERLRANSIAIDLSLGAAWTSALASALLALCAGPLLAHLPGLAPLRSRRW